MSFALKSDRATRFLAGLPSQQRWIVKTLRHLIHEIVPGADETIFWGSLSYHRPEFGGRIKGAVCLITPRFDRVHLGFIHGVALADPHHLLQGARKSKRFVSIDSPRDIDSDSLRALIRAAADYDPRKGSGCFCKE